MQSARHCYHRRVSSSRSVPTAVAPGLTEVGMGIKGLVCLSRRGCAADEEHGARFVSRERGGRRRAKRFAAANDAGARTPSFAPASRVSGLRPATSKTVRSCRAHAGNSEMMRLEGRYEGAKTYLAVMGAW